MTLRARLIAGMAFVAVVLLCVSFALTATTRGQLIDQVDSRLAMVSPGARVDGLDPALAQGSDAGAPPPPAKASPPADDLSERLSDMFEGFVREDGTLVTRFVPNIGNGEFGVPAIDVDALRDELSAADSVTFTTGSVEGSVTYRVLAQPINGEVVIITALPIDDVEQTIARLIWVEVIGSLAILAALGIVGWWVLHLGIRPVKEMTETATRIAAGDLTIRVEGAAPGTESGQLAVALNQMLGRIEGALDERAESEERLRRFVADASHELRTPITTIRGYSELYRHGGLSNPDSLDDAMRRTEQEASRMGRLVEDMLTLAKLDEARAMETAQIDIADSVRDAAADACAIAPDRTIGVVVTGRSMIDGDDDRVRQVLANVIGNALVHTEPGVAIDLRVRGDERFVTVEVADHGVGMSPEEAKRATERFFRADPSRSRHRGGSGLGLAIVAATMEAHGGTVEVDSEPGRGTVVRLRFPASSTLIV